MSDAVTNALETVHAALNADNAGLDAAIAALKAVLVEQGEKQVLMKKERLPNNTRPGRKMLQTYFKKRGVDVAFSE
jgi:hypothetical protein